MRALLILLVALGAAYYFFYYQKRNEEAKAPVAAATPMAAAALAATPTPTPAPSVSRGFDDVAALLRQDMKAIPVALDGPGRSPANAVTIKRKVVPYVSIHPEYQVLTQACDVIIQADAQRAAFQQACRTEQSRAGFGSLMNSNGSLDHAVPASHKAAAAADEARQKAVQDEIHQRKESSWTSYRATADGQVQELLGSLAGKHL